MGLTGKEYHIKFVRRQSKLTGKYHTAVRLKRANAPAFKQEGILYRICDRQQPSVKVQSTLYQL